MWKCSDLLLNCTVLWSKIIRIGLVHVEFTVRTSSWYVSINKRLFYYPYLFIDGQKRPDRQQLTNNLCCKTFKKIFPGSGFWIILWNVICLICDSTKTIWLLPVDFYKVKPRSRNLRPRLHVSGFVCIRKHFAADWKVYASTPHTYPDSLRFQGPTHIRENDMNTLEMLTVHALLRMMKPWCR